MLQTAIERKDVSPAGLDFIKGFESFVPWVYDDKLAPIRQGGKLQYREWKPGDRIVGTLTIGYGHTDAAKYKLPFLLRNVPAGFRLTEAEACHILDVDLDECEDDVAELVKVPIQLGMRDALISFDLNCGRGNLVQLIKPLNQGNYAATRAAFDKYNRSKGQYMRGLARRRDGEQKLWDMAEAPVIVPNLVPAEPVHHPAEVDAKVETAADLRPYSRKLQSLHQSKIAGGLTAAGFGAKIFTDVVNQAKGVSDAINVVSGDGLLLVCAAMAVVVVVVVGLHEGWSLSDFLSGRWLPSGFGTDDGDEHGQPVAAGA